MNINERGMHFDNTVFDFLSDFIADPIIQRRRNKYISLILLIRELEKWAYGILKSKAAD